MAANKVESCTQACVQVVLDRCDKQIRSHEGLDADQVLDLYRRVAPKYLDAVTASCRTGCERLYGGRYQNPLNAGDDIARDMLGDIDRESSSPPIPSLGEICRKLRDGHAVEPVVQKHLYEAPNASSTSGAVSLKQGKIIGGAATVTMAALYYFLGRGNGGGGASGSGHVDELAARRTRPVQVGGADEAAKAAYISALGAGAVVAARYIARAALVALLVGSR